MTPVAMPPVDRSFFGQPRGLRVLALSQAWERFSYAGMQTLLVLYAAHSLFQPGHIEGIWGYPLIVAVYGHPTPEVLASHIFGLYAGLVYLTPILGGAVADRWLGKTRAVILGAGLLTLGHWLMGEEATFLVALLCLVLGVGFFKTNITGQVGDLYAVDDPRRASAFQLFVLFISVAAVIAPLVCGTLGEKLAWKWGFGAAGIGMVVGLVTYLSGRKYLPPEPPRAARETRPPMTADERRVILVLVLLLPVLALAFIGNEQMFNAYLLWAERSYDLSIGGWTMPVTWLISIDSLIAIAAMTGSLAFWRWWGTKRTEPDEITKLTLGAMICTLAPLVLVAAAVAAEGSGGGRVSLAWALPFHAINEIGFANLYPVGMALFSRCAPRGLGSTMIAVFFLHIFASNLLVGWLGGFLGSMSGPAFWGLHAGLMGVAAVVLLLVRSVAGRILAPTDRPEAPGAALAAA